MNNEICWEDLLKNATLARSEVFAEGAELRPYRRIIAAPRRPRRQIPVHIWFILMSLRKGRPR